MSPPRQIWLDWLRGLAMLCMIEVHIVDSWLLPAERTGALHQALGYLGGLAAPGFFFMAGMSQRLADRALADQGVAPRERLRIALRRAAWLLGVAYAFHTAEFVLGGAFLRADGWTRIVRVDVLNVIALSLALTALLSAGADATGAIWRGAAGALANHPPPPGYLTDYLFALPPRTNFCLFNWAAFGCAGLAFAGLVERRVPRLALLAIGLALYLGYHLPTMISDPTGRISPGFFSARLGWIVIAGAVLSLLPAAAGRVLSWLTVLGRNSLLGYMASVELTYSAIAWPVRGKLSMAATLAGVVLMTALVWGLVTAWERRQRRLRDAGGQRRS